MLLPGNDQTVQSGLKTAEYIKSPAFDGYGKEIFPCHEKRTHTESEWTI